MSSFSRDGDLTVVSYAVESMPFDFDYPGGDWNYGVAIESGTATP